MQADHVALRTPQAGRGQRVGNDGGGASSVHGTGTAYGDLLRRPAAWRQPEGNGHPPDMRQMTVFRRQGAGGVRKRLMNSGFRAGSPADSPWLPQPRWVSRASCLVVSRPCTTTTGPDCAPIQNGVHDGGGAGVAGDVGDKRAVDFQPVNRKMPQIRQGRTAGAKVVNGQAHAKCA